MNDEVQKIIEEQFNALPQVVQEAITSGHIKDRFRAMAEKYQVHLDTWQEVENKIMFTVLGLIAPENLTSEIVKSTNIDEKTADTIVNDVATSIFKPIREELERELGHPDARKENVSDVEKVRTEVLAQSSEGKISGTPGNTLSKEKVARAPASGAYIPGQASTERADIDDDPYREPPK